MTSDKHLVKVYPEQIVYNRDEGAKNRSLFLTSDKHLVKVYPEQIVYNRDEGAKNRSLFLERKGASHE